jgi:hypothetical protein
MRFRIALLEDPVRPVGYITTKTNNAEKATSSAHMHVGVGAYGPISGPGRWDRGYTQVESDHLSAYKVACIGQEMDVD